MSFLALYLATTVASANVEKVLNDARVRRAMEIVSASEEWTLQQLVELTEIPAPPFHEDERAEAYMERFRSLGLEKFGKTKRVTFSANVPVSAMDRRWCSQPTSILSFLQGRT